MKVLVTGGTGFLGSFVVRALAERGDSVRVLHRPSSDLGALAGTPFEPAPGDVTDPGSVLAACRGVEAVFHCAGVVGHSPAELPLMESVNVEGTRHVVAAVLAEGVRRLVHVSSVVAVGARRTPGLLDESSRFDPEVVRSSYALTKRRAEELVLEAVATRKLDAVSINPSVIFGPGDAVKGSRRTYLLVAAGRFPILPPGGASFVDVADVVAAALAALERGRAGERYIVGSENLLLADLFRLIASAGGSAPPRLALPRWAFLAAVRAIETAMWLRLAPRLPTDSYHAAALFHWYDGSKARRELGVAFRPVRPAIEASVRWARERGLC